LTSPCRLINPFRVGFDLSLAVVNVLTNLEVLSLSKLLKNPISLRNRIFFKRR
jgi:hypothetical protein